MNVYTVEKVTSKDLTPQVLYLIEQGAAECNIKYGKKFDWYDFDIKAYADKHPLFVCYRDGNPVGFLAATFSNAFFDPKLKYLYQQLLFAFPGTRASHHLLKAFIDFGNKYADHIFTARGLETNIKSSSLERLGFKKTEEIFRIEVQKCSQETTEQIL